MGREADVLYGVTMQEVGVSRMLTINRNDFLCHWTCIDQNPARWAEDEYRADNLQLGGIP